jgi:hypothetical protein
VSVRQGVFAVLAFLSGSVLIGATLWALPKTPTFIESLIEGVVRLEGAGVGAAPALDIVVLALVTLTLSIGAASTALARFCIHAFQRALWKRSTVRLNPQPPGWDRVWMILVTFAVSIAAVKIL